MTGLATLTSVSTATQAIADVVSGILIGPPIRENSIKLMAGGRADHDRFLWSWPRQALYPGPATRFSRLGAALGLAGSAFDRLAATLSDARAVHVGADRGLPKIYLEYALSRTPVPGVAYLAVKSAGEGGAQGGAVSGRYTAVPRADRTDLLWGTVRDPALRALMVDCLLAAEGVGGGVMVVTEDGSARQSLDVKVADLGWTLQDLAGLGAALAALGQRDDTLAAIMDRPLGHVAAGQSADGQAFLTLYHSAQAIL